MKSSFSIQQTIFIFLLINFFITSNLNAQWYRTGDIRLGYASLGISKSGQASYDKTHNKIYTWGFVGADAIFVYDIPSNSFVRRIDVNRSIYNINIDEFNNHVYIVTGIGFDRIDLNTGNRIDFIEESGLTNYQSRQLLVDLNNSQIISHFKTFTAIDGVHYSKLLFYDHNTLENKHSVEIPHIPLRGSMIVSPKFNELFIRSEINNSIYVMNLSTYQILDTISIESSHPDGDNIISWLKIDTINNYLYVPITRIDDPNRNPDFFSLIKIYDTQTHQLIKEIDFMEPNPHGGGYTGWFNHFEINPEKNELYISKINQNIEIYSISEFIKKGELKMNVGSSWEPIIIPSNKHSTIYIAGYDLQLYNMNNGEYMGEVDSGTLPMSINISERENKLFIRELQNHKISILQDGNYNNQTNLLETYKYIRIWADAGEIEDNAIDKTNKRYIANSEIKNSVLVYDFSSKDTLSLMIDRVTDVEISANGDKTFFLQSNNHTLLEYNKSLEFNKSYNIPKFSSEIAYDNHDFIYLNRKEGQYDNCPSCQTKDPNTIFRYKLSENTLDSIKVGIDLRDIKYIPKESALITWTRRKTTDNPDGTQTLIWPNMLYKIDSSSFTVVDSIEIDFNFNLWAYHESYNKLFTIGGNRFSTINLQTFEVESEQTLENSLRATAININEATNTLYISNMLNGFIYKYRNDVYPSYPPPSTPQFDSVSVGDTRLFLHWSPNIEAEYGYNIYRQKEQGVWIKVNREPIIDTTFADSRLSNNSQYNYKISSVGKYYIESEYSRSLNSTPINLPDFEINLVESDPLITNDGKEAEFVFTIAKEEEFDHDITLTIDSLQNGITPVFSTELITDEALFTLNLNANSNIPEGSYIFLIIAEGSVQQHIYRINYSVKNSLFTSFSITPNTCTVEESATLKGQTILNPGAEVFLFSDYGKEEFLAYDTLIVKDDKSISSTIDFDMSGLWRFYIKSNGVESDTQNVVVERSPTFISVNIEDLSAIDTSKMVTISGKIFPSNESGSINLSITKPDLSKEIINDIPYNFLGTFGYDILIDQVGIWMITASWDGDEKYLGTSSNPLIIPIHVSTGRAIILTTSADNDPLNSDSIAIKLSSYAYQVIRERAIPPEDIYFMNENLNLDVNKDGVADEVDTLNTLENFKKIFNRWITNDTVQTTPTFIYLCGSFNDSIFHINNNESFTIDSLENLLAPKQTIESIENCENFDSFNANEFIAVQSSDWTTWDIQPGTTQDAYVTNELFLSPPNSLIIDTALAYTDLVYPLDITEGNWCIEYDIFIPEGENTYGSFIVLQDAQQIGGNNVVGAIIDFYKEGYGEISNVVNERIGFTYKKGEWIHGKLNINLNTFQAEFYLNNDLITEWKWNIDGPNKIGTINFYANPEIGKPLFYIDNLCITEFKESTEFINTSNIIFLTEGNIDQDVLNKTNLSSTNIIASSSETNSNYYPESDASFSYYFLNHIYLGYSLGESFEYANSIIKSYPELFESQNPALNFNLNNSFNDDDDFNISNRTYFGAAYSITNLPPNISGTGSNLGDTPDPLKSNSNYLAASYYKDAVNTEGLTLWTIVDDFENNISNINGYLIDPNKNKTYLDFQSVGYNNLYSTYLNQGSDIGLYSLYLFAKDYSGNLSTPKLTQFILKVNATGIDDVYNNFFQGYQLSQNFPNPFRYETKIGLTIPNQEIVDIIIYDIFGKKIRTFERRSYSTGTHTLKWDGKDDSMKSCAPGYYFLILKAGKYYKTRKILLVN